MKMTLLALKLKIRYGLHINRPGLTVLIVLLFILAVVPGEGRLIQCIDKNKEKISDRCKQAIRDVQNK